MFIVIFVLFPRELWNSNRNANRKTSAGEVVYGRYLQDLPSRKIAEIEKNACAALCAPPECLRSVHESVMKKEENNSAQVNTQDTILKSEIFGF